VDDTFDVCSVIVHAMIAADNRNGTRKVRGRTSGGVWKTVSELDKQKVNLQAYTQRRDSFKILHKPC